MNIKVNRKAKYLLLLIITIPLSILVAYLLFFSKEPGVQDYQAKCDIDTTTTCIVEEALKQGKQLGPAQALVNFQKYTEKYKTTSECHDLYHAVGSSYYTEFKEKALVEGVASCIGAYYHGVLQEQGRTYEGNIDNYAEQTIKLCTKLEKLDFIQCAHGVGHGAYMATNKNYEKALELCKETPWGKDCSSGVFMEIIADDTNAPKFGKENFDNFQAKDCVIFTNKTLNNSCFLETHLTDTLPKRIASSEACALTTSEYTNTCLIHYGLALTITLSNYKEQYTTDRLEAYKNGLNECLTNEFCLQGFLGIPKNMFSSTQAAEQYCLFFIENYGDLNSVGKCTQN